ncbi:MAG TPA: prepilin-type N-terminal cleavage/methylation domain-containing protein [Gammaproteobacteria bacterium]|nr:prepilin-type N-terminal cleavage/methylation domain-containing protein [Gammaproteobacteria bacterium]
MRGVYEHPPSNLGLTLIEVLISLFILTFLLLGVHATQLFALQKAKSTYYFSVATQQLHNMMLRLKVMTIATDLSTQLTHWNQQNQQVLPQGNGTVQCDNATCQLTIFWGGESPLTCINNQIGSAGCIRVETFL